MNFVKKFDINGILLLDKPYGISSNCALQAIKKIYKAKKAGYIGTLDPIATGILPICFGKTTKFSQILSNTDKYYYVVARLGQKTDTFDSTGTIIEEKIVKFSKQLLNKSINSFLGTTYQIPPIYSAIKHNGIPLYKYARKKMKLPILNSREIIVYNIKVVYCLGYEISLNIHCSKGTYIRSIINDLGEKLGCGAHIIMLRRLQLTKYSKENMITIDYLNSLVNKYSTNFQYNIISILQSLLLSVDNFLYFLPEINLNEKLILLLKQGVSIKINHNNESGTLIRITSGNMRKFIGIAEITKGGNIIPRCLVF